jgi:hypothetical protein
MNKKFHFDTTWNNLRIFDITNIIKSKTGLIDEYL